jgi:hypothetical protein
MLGHIRALEQELESKAEELDAAHEQLHRCYPQQAGELPGARADVPSDVDEHVTSVITAATVTSTLTLPLLALVHSDHVLFSGPQRSLTPAVLLLCALRSLR